MENNALNENVDTLEQKQSRPKGLIAKRVLQIISVVVYALTALFFLYLLIDISKTESESFGLGYAVYIVLILTFGIGFNVLSSGLSVASLVVTKKYNLGNILLPIIFIILPIFTEIILIALPYILT